MRDEIEPAPSKAAMVRVPAERRCGAISSGQTLSVEKEYDPRRTAPLPAAPVQPDRQDRAGRTRIPAVQIGAGWCNRLELDRTEAVTPVHAEHRDEENSRHRNTGQRQEGVEQDNEAAQQFGEDRQPAIQCGVGRSTKVSKNQVVCT